MNKNKFIIQVIYNIRGLQFKIIQLNRFHLNFACQMKKQRGSWVKKFFRNLFISDSTISENFQTLLSLAQYFIFIVLTASQSITASYFSFVSIDIYLLILISIIIAIRLSTTVNFVKCIYIPLLVLNMDGIWTIQTFIIFGLLAIAVLADTTSKICFSFSTDNVHSQHICGFIILHYSILVVLTILRNCALKTFIKSICGFILFTILILIKQKSACRSRTYKQLNLRFYYICLFYYLVREFTNFINMSQLFYQHLIVLVVSQIAYYIVRIKLRNQLNIQEQFSKGLYLKAGFTILSYLNSNRYDYNIQKSINSYINSDQSNGLIDYKQQDQQGKAKEFTCFKNSRKRKDFLLKIFNLVKQNQTSLRSQLFLAQLHLKQLNNFYPSKIILTQAKQKFQKFNFINYILISKTQMLVQEATSVEYKKQNCQNFQEFINNDLFRTQLLKSCLDFYQLWQYTVIPDMIYKNVNKLINKVIYNQKRVRQEYFKLKFTCMKTSGLFSEYLYYVSKDVKLANQVVQNTHFYHDKLISLKSDKKLYIKISLQADSFLTITNVGSNVNKLLGYDRRLLIGSNISTFLPHFFIDDHQQILHDLLDHNSSRLLLTTRTTVIKNSRQSYEQAFICLRLTLNHDSQIFMHGFIRLIPNPQFIWNNYIFINQHGFQIVQCSEKARQVINLKIGQVPSSAADLFHNFTNRPFIGIQYFESSSTQYIYEPVKKFFCSKQQTIVMFVRINYVSNFQRQFKGEIPEEGHNNFSMNFLKLSDMIVNDVLVQKMKSFKRIKLNKSCQNVLLIKMDYDKKQSTANKKIIIAMFTALFCIASIFIIQGVQVKQTQSNYQYKQQTIQITSNIVEHYMSMSKMSVDLSYLKISLEQNYTSLLFKADLQKNIQTLQTTGNFFKNLSISKYNNGSFQFSTFKIINDLIGSAQLIDIIKDQTLKQSFLNDFQAIYEDIFLTTYSQYYERAIDSLDNQKNYVIIIQALLTTLIILLLIIAYILILKLQTWIRQTQSESIHFVNFIGLQQHLIQDIKIFISSITHQKIQDLVIGSRNKSNAKAALQKMLPKGELTSRQKGQKGQNSSRQSSRQNTGRQLMSPGATRQGFDITRQVISKSLELQQKVKIKPRSKLIIIVPLLMFLTIILIQLYNQIVNIYFVSINGSQSASNVVFIMNKPLYFSRVVNSYMLQDHSSKNHSALFYELVSQFTNQNSNIVTFSQFKYAQFNGFQSDINMIRFQYLCTYVTCPPKYYDVLNIIYTTTMQKLVDYMKINLFNDVKKTNYMEIILVAEDLFRTKMHSILRTYLKDCQDYTFNLKNKQQMLQTIILTIVFVIFVVNFAAGFFVVRKKLDKFRRISELVKFSSYLVDEERFKHNIKQQMHKSALSKSRSDKAKTRKSFKVQLDEEKQLTKTESIFVTGANQNVKASNMVQSSKNPQVLSKFREQKKGLDKSSNNLSL